MSEPLTAPVDPTTEPGADEPRRVLRWADVRRAVLVAALGLGLGALGGVVWWLVTDLPTFRVVTGGGAVTSERGLATYVAADAWFVVCGALVGLVVGITAWRVFRRSGWGVVVLAVLVAGAAGLLCWAVGSALGPGDFDTRLAAAVPGDVVPVELTVRARSALLVWPLLAVLPVLLGSSLGHDPEVDAAEASATAT